MSLDALLDSNPELETMLLQALSKRKRKKEQGTNPTDTGDASYMVRDDTGSVVNERSAFGLRAPVEPEDALTLEGSTTRTLGGLMAPGADEDAGTKAALINMLLSNETGDALRVTAERNRKQINGMTLPED